MTSTSSVLDAPSDALASVPSEQRPRIYSVPDYVSTSGREAIELGEMAGIYLDPWQQLALMDLLGEKANGQWAAFSAGLVCSRQNGKNEILLVRELAGMFLLDERLIVHSAHEFGTATEHFMRLVAVIEATPALSRRVKKNGIKTGNGKEGITLKGGQRLSLKARRKGTGRGFTADLVVLDEAWDLSETAHGAILPTLSTRPNPQVIYAGTAVDQWVHDNGIVLARARERGIAGDTDGHAYIEWSAHVGDPAEDDPTKLPAETLADEALWREANPTFGIRLSADYISKEHRSLDPRSFAVERLGIGDWPSTDGEGEQIITAAKWLAGFDENSRAEDPVALAIDVTPSRERAAIGAAGQREDGLPHVEVVEHGQGTGWVVDRMTELVAKHRPRAVVVDGRSAAASLVPALEEAGIEVTVLSTADYGRACGAFFDVVDQERLRHRNPPELQAAVRGAQQRPLGDAWAWARKAGDISPLVAVTLALWGLGVSGESVYGRRHREGHALL